MKHDNARIFLRNIRSAHGLFLCTLLSLFAVPGARAQTPAKPMIQGDNAAVRMELERQRLASDQRQQKMLQDADKLLQMAQQLKLSVDKTDKYTLSVDVVKEAERIEKLARQVKENMRQ